MSTFFENTSKLVDEAAKVLGLSETVLERLKKPDKIMELEISLKSASGEEQKFPAWRVQHNNVLGPYKGGIRFHPDSNLDEVKALASLMTWKTSLMGIPYGGAKGAVKVDSRSLSMIELENISRGYVRGLGRGIGPQKDIPAPDVGTSPQVMDWMADEYAKIVGYWEPAAFTGKSVDKGGSYGREIATGFGGYVVLREFLKLGNPVSKLETGFPSVAVQGFGNVGSNIAKILFDRGFKIVAISDSKGALYEEGGIDIDKVLDVKEKTGIIDRTKCYAVSKERQDAKTPCREFNNQDLLALDVDILIPAALENVITKENAGDVKAKVILEMANGPVTPEAEEILNSRGVEIIPDILANGGGVVGSYFEWVQSLGQKYWTEVEVLERIDNKLTEAFKAVYEIKRQFNASWRTASYIRAVRRVAEAL